MQTTLNINRDTKKRSQPFSLLDAMPPFGAYKAERRKSRFQSPRQMFEALKAIAVASGGRVIKGKGADDVS